MKEKNRETKRDTHRGMHKVRNKKEAGSEQYTDRQILEWRGYEKVFCETRRYASLAKSCLNVSKHYLFKSLTQHKWHEKMQWFFCWINLFSLLVNILSTHFGQHSWFFSTLVATFIPAYFPLVSLNQVRTLVWVLFLIQCSVAAVLMAPGLTYWHVIHQTGCGHWFWSTKTLDLACLSVFLLWTL